MELSWVHEKSNGRHELVPEKYYKSADKVGKDAMDDDESDNEVA